MITPVFDGAKEEQIKENIRKAKAKLVEEKKKDFVARGFKGEELEECS